MKLLVDANDDRILGFTMIGSDAGEVMAVVQTAMPAGISYSTLRDVIFAHPTMAEGPNFLFANVPARNVQQATPQTFGGVMKEAQQHPELLDRLRSLARGSPLTLVYFARDEERNDAVELRHRLNACRR
jgi:hypothetical protein